MNRATMKSTRVRLGVLLLAGVCALPACSSKSGSSASSGGGAATEISLGASVSVTGAASVIGVNWQKGIQLAVDTANGANGFTVAGKNYKWKLDLKDDQSLPDQAIAAYRAFVGNNTKFILGPGLSTAFPPAFNSLGSYQALVMTPASAAATPFIGKPKGQDLLITHLADKGSDGRVANVVATLVSQFHPQKVAILLPQDGPGELYTTTFTQYLKAANVDVVYSKGFPGDTSDFSSYITSIKAASPDMVISGYLDASMKPFLTQAAGAGLTSPVFVGAPGSDAAALPAGSPIQKYVWSVTTRSVDNTTDPQVQPFRAAWKAKFGSDPDSTGFWALSYYDPVLILTQAMQKAGTVSDLAKIKAAMVGSTQWSDTVLGERFDATSQQAVYGPQIGVYDNGKISYVASK